MGRWCHNPDTGVQGDNPCVPCILYSKKKASGKKETNVLLLFFRLNYGNAANQNMFANKVDM